MPPSNHRVLKRCLDKRETGSHTTSRDPAIVRLRTERRRSKPPASTHAYIQSHSCGLTEGARVSAVAKPNDERLAEISRCVDETQTRDHCRRRAVKAEVSRGPHEHLAVTG